MKILVIGDFHGNFSKKFNKIIDKENINLVVSLGDYPPFHYRKIWFKHCYRKDVELWEVIGKKKYKELVSKDLRLAENALNKLNKLKVPIYTTLGNIDWPSPDDIMDIMKKTKKSMPNFDKKDRLTKRLKNYKNIKRLDYRALKFKDYVFIGMRGHSHPGKVKSKAFRKHKKIIEGLFKKFKKENKNNKVIFVSHNVPYNTKLDKIGKHAHKEVRGKHFGSKLAKRIITKYQPILALGGHIHESSGRDKIKKTTIINPGAANVGKGAIIEIVKGSIKNIEFLK
nr:metallophosphoesterase [Candidatus Woesearchaeota archaeon]